ncbi:MAG: hypothetical protein ACQCN3_06820 [Candidatus Bathyarchaeia archaeon]|jgi:hypothetical protein
MEQFFVFLVFTAIVVLVLFLPSLFELKKPKDTGPRKIVGFKTGVILPTSNEQAPSKQPLNGNLAAVDPLTNLEV